jgi:hypothetical protein
MKLKNGPILVYAAKKAFDQLSSSETADSVDFIQRFKSMAMKVEIMEGPKDSSYVLRRICKIFL